VSAKADNFALRAMARTFKAQAAGALANKAFAQKMIHVALKAWKEHKDCAFHETCLDGERAAPQARPNRRLRER
jgi:hypothetical protein